MRQRSPFQHVKFSIDCISDSEPGFTADSNLYKAKATSGKRCSCVRFIETASAVELFVSNVSADVPMDDSNIWDNKRTLPRRKASSDSSIRESQEHSTGTSLSESTSGIAGSHFTRTGYLLKPALAGNTPSSLAINVQEVTRGDSPESGNSDARVLREQG